jgi:uncharacterized membrane protein YfcA
MSPLVLLLISTVAGLVGAMSGMGGGVVLVPVLTWLGIDIKHAIAASMISVIATSSGSASAYARAHTTNLKVGMFLEMFTIVGAMVGASIAIGAKQNVLAIIFGGILLFSWVVLWFKGNEWHPIKWQDNFSRKLQLEGRYHDSAEHRNIEYRARRAYFGGPLMFGAGLIAGLLGIGAGAVKVLIHDVIMGLPPKVSTTTSNLIIGVTGLAGTSVYFASGLIEPTIAVPVIPGILAGATVGTFVLQKLTSRAVQRFFLVVLLVLGVEMIYRGLHGLL